jgi:glyoxylase-like metal-dependent hydrolase (beta-lactamase superfamily II)
LSFAYASEKSLLYNLVSVGGSLVTKTATAAAVIALCGVGIAGLWSDQARASSARAYEVYAVRFAKSPGDPVSDYVAGADATRRMDGVYMLWLLKAADGRIALVDAGFYRDKFMPRWKPMDYVRPTEALRRAGVRPEDVHDIIVTHVHWDHLDGVDLFPRALVWIQKAEYEYYVDSAGRTPHRTIDPDDAAMLVSMKRAGRVMLIEGDTQEVLPGVKVYTGGKHTYASQYVAVPTRSGVVVLASDNVYVYENLDKHLAIAHTLDPAANLRAQERMLRIASNRRLVIPGHDAQVFLRFPIVGDGIVRID